MKSLVQYIIESQNFLVNKHTSKSNISLEDLKNIENKDITINGINFGIYKRNSGVNTIRFKEKDKDVLLKMYDYVFNILDELSIKETKKIYSINYYNVGFNDGFIIRTSKNQEKCLFSLYNSAKENRWELLIEKPYEVIEDTSSESHKQIINKIKELLS